MRNFKAERVLFYTNSRVALNIEATLTVATKFLLNGWDVYYIATNISYFDKVLAKRHFDLRDGMRIVYLEELLFGNVFIFFFKNKKVVNLKTYYKFLFIIKQLFYFIYKFKVKNLINNSNLIFSANITSKGEDRFEKYFYHFSNKSKSIFIGYPLVVWPHFYQKSIYPFDYFLTNSRNELSEIKSKGLHKNAIFLGCPFFDNEYSSGSCCASNEKSILFLMVNLNNHIYESDIINEVFHFIECLLNLGYRITLKLHPKDDTNYFVSLQSYENFFISNNTLHLLAQNNNIAITLLSVSILVPVSFGLRSYLFLPDKLLRTLSEMEYEKSVYFKEGIMNETWINNYVEQIKSIDDFIQYESCYKSKRLDFEKEFFPLNAAERIYQFFRLTNP